MALLLGRVRRLESASCGKEGVPNRISLGSGLEWRLTPTQHLHHAFRSRPPASNEKGERPKRLLSSESLPLPPRLHFLGQQAVVDELIEGCRDTRFTAKTHH